MSEAESLPIIDIAPLSGGGAAAAAVGAAIDRACRESGFFYVVGHGVDPDALRRLDRLSRAFFALDLEEKMRIRMALGGRAWRGYFPVGAELTSGKPDQKEGLYFGAELDDRHPAVRASIPLHGRNLFPDRPPELRSAVLDHLAAMTRLGHRLMEGIALALGLERGFFADRYTSDPLILFRIFHYPPLPAGVEADRAVLGANDERAEGVVHTTPGGSLWSVGEHTDYGLLTILMQDEIGGLAVKSKGGWIEAPPIPGSFVCNIGDMLDRQTSGLYRSTPHRVRNRSDRGRLSFPFFFDPGWNARIAPIPTEAALRDDREERWDHASVHEFHGTYGEYLLGKIGRVFPDLGERVL
ncbi:MAG TPA: 2-oxoglutarate and iron-dependent oxygenase domain-containing protein [Thermoanaerobaculia bacterium]|nr:2-oxoglutarate and iron-dependent oxygenase domain-containing protein [Thermoanaerobaculia bacterium]